MRGVLLFSRAGIAASRLLLFSRSLSRSSSPAAAEEEEIVVQEREREEADKGREVVVEEGDESGFLRSLRSLAWWSIFVVLLPICFPTISSLALSFLSASNSPTSRSGGRWRPVALEDWLREVVSKRV